MVDLKSRSSPCGSRSSLLRNGRHRAEGRQPESQCARHPDNRRHRRESGLDVVVEGDAESLWVTPIAGPGGVFSGLDPGSRSARDDPLRTARSSSPSCTSSGVLHQRRSDGGGGRGRASRRSLSRPVDARSLSFRRYRSDVGDLPDQLGACLGLGRVAPRRQALNRFFRATGHKQRPQNPICRSFG
jgi:hypothetical protein